MFNIVLKRKYYRSSFVSMNEFKFITLGDLHIGKLKTYFPNNSEELLNKYFDNLILYCKNNGVSTIMQLGDIFDVNTPNQNDINYFIRVLHKFEDNNISFYAITGNHDYKYNSELKSTGTIEQLIDLNKFKNIHIYSKPKIEYINGFPFSFLPFPEYRIPEELDKSICLLHIDINTYKHINCGNAIDIKNGISVDNFKNNNLYLCGHVHTKQYNKNNPNIYYIGTPYQISFSEVQKNGLPETKSVRLITLTKNEVNFDYKIEEVFLPESFKLTILFIESSYQLQNIDSYSLESDRLTLKIKDENLQVPLKITEDERVYKIIGNSQNTNLNSFEEVFEDYTEDSLKEDIIKYIEDSNFNVDNNILKSLFLSLWK